MIFFSSSIFPLNQNNQLGADIWVLREFKFSSLREIYLSFIYFCAVNHRAKIKNVVIQAQFLTRKAWHFTS